MSRWLSESASSKSARPTSRHDISPSAVRSTCWRSCFLALGPAALVFRRRYPVTVLLVSSATVLAYWVIGYGRGPVFLAMIVALVTVVMAGRRAVAAAFLVGGYVCFQWLAPLLGRDGVRASVRPPRWRRGCSCSTAAASWSEYGRNGW